jgi:hypothetical protein
MYGFPWRRTVGLGLLIVVLAVLFATSDVRALLQDALSWIEGLGAWGRVLFVALYVAATGCSFPEPRLVWARGRCLVSAAGQCWFHRHPLLPRRAPSCWGAPWRAIGLREESKAIPDRARAGAGLAAGPAARGDTGSPLAVAGASVRR